MTRSNEFSSEFSRFQLRSLLAGVVGAALLAVGAIVSTREFYQAYLYGYIVWMGLTLGCLGVLILHHLVSGSWGHLIQRVVEAGARTLPVMAVLFLPILFGLHELYPWTNREAVEASHVIAKKLGYLNIPFFLVRAAAFFGCWITLAFILTRWSRRQDTTGDASISRRMKIFSGPAMVLFVLSVTLASVDWMMSLEPEWYSTIYGMMTIVGAVLTTLAFAILWVSFLSSRTPVSGILTTRHVHHLGNLLMAFTILWAYLAFSQFLIIWSGNLPEDSMWYMRRLGSGWNIIALVLIVGHFFVPFLLLLSRKRKRLVKSLARVAAGILVMRLVDLFWLIIPAFSGTQVTFRWMDLAAPVAIGGIWLAFFFRDLKGQPILPLHDARFVDGQSIYQH
jgi:hypothetical protein